MTYTCFPNQTPFPLPPGITTPPTSPSFTDNGPQLPANSIDIWWTLALISDPGSFVDWLEAEISADVPVADWLSALISSESYPTELDLCELVNLLGLLPEDETFIPEQEDPDSPILPPYQEKFYVEAPIRLSGAWFFIPGPVVVQAGDVSLSASLIGACSQLVVASVSIKLDIVASSQFVDISPVVMLGLDVLPIALAAVKTKASMLMVEPGTSTTESVGMEFGATLTAT